MVGGLVAVGAALAPPAEELEEEEEQLDEELEEELLLLGAAYEATMAEEPLLEDPSFSSSCFLMPAVRISLIFCSHTHRQYHKYERIYAMAGRPTSSGWPLIRLATLAQPRCKRLLTSI